MMPRMTTTDLYLVLSCLGPDRPGLVAEVTHYLTEHGANVEDSRMAVLGGEFGILLLASGAPGALDAIERDKEALIQTTGLTVVTRRTKSPEEHRRAATVPCIVAVEALDHEGIVRSVSRALQGAGVNIVSLETTAYEAPVTGSQLFRMEARVDVPAGVTLAKLRKAMDAVAEAENLDIDVRSLIKS
jgi:glycine cleavage system transcriptional repressor